MRDHKEQEACQIDNVMEERSAPPDTCQVHEPQALDGNVPSNEMNYM